MISHSFLVILDVNGGHCLDVDIAIGAGDTASTRQWEIKVWLAFFERKVLSNVHKMYIILILMKNGYFSDLWTTNTFFVRWKARHDFQIIIFCVRHFQIDFLQWDELMSSKIRIFLGEAQPNPKKNPNLKLRSNSLNRKKSIWQCQTQKIMIRKSGLLWTVRSKCKCCE